jgi:hypothetical protein
MRDTFFPYLVFHTVWGGFVSWGSARLARPADGILAVLDKSMKCPFSAKYKAIFPIWM